MFSPDSHILVIDDSSAVRSLVKQQLTALGFRNVLEAEHGKEALEKLDSLSKVGVDVHLLICDWNMPEMNGLELVKQLRKDPTLASLKVLMVTTETEMGQMASSLEAGADEYVMKPFTKDILVEKLELVGISVLARV